MKRFKITFIYLIPCGWGHTNATMELILSFYNVGPWGQIQIITLGNKCLYLLRHSSIAVSS